MLEVFEIFENFFFQKPKKKIQQIKKNSSLPEILLCIKRKKKERFVFWQMMQTTLVDNSEVKQEFFLSDKCQEISDLVFQNINYLGQQYYKQIVENLQEYGTYLDEELSSVQMEHLHQMLANVLSVVGICCAPETKKDN